MHSLPKAMALSTLFTASYAINSWQVAFWSGTLCTSESTGIDQGTVDAKLSKVCNLIPNLEFTQTFDFQTADDGIVYILGLHKSDDCSDSGGSYRGSTEPICEETRGGFTHYSITTLDYQKRELAGERQLTSARGANVALDKRQNLEYLAMSLTGTVASAHFFATSVGKCGRAVTNKDGVEAGECGANITFGTFFAFITAYGLNRYLKGERRTTGPAKMMRRYGSGDFSEELGDMFTQSIFTPFPFTNIIDGYSGVIDHLLM